MKRRTKTDATCRWCEQTATAIEPRTGRRICSKCLTEVAAWELCDLCEGTGWERGEGNFDGVLVECGCGKGLVEP